MPYVHLNLRNCLVPKHLNFDSHFLQKCWSEGMLQMMNVRVDIRVGSLQRHTEESVVCALKY